MRFRHLAGAALALAALALPGSTQSVAQQLQEGVYAQQVVGDLDGAIRIYRQIIASNPAKRVYAAQAQMHLAQALLQKGDLAGAAQEFTTLSANYSEFRDAIASMAGNVAGGMAANVAGNVAAGVAAGLAGSMTLPGNAIVFSLGTAMLADGQRDRYIHKATGVELTAPQGWRLAGDNYSSGGGQMVLFSSSSFEADQLAVWLKPQDAPADIPAALRREMERKAQDRAGLTGWRIRPESVQMREVGGQPALSAVADYDELGLRYTVRFADGQNITGFGLSKPDNTAEKMVEYLTWVQSPKAHVFFFGRANASDLAALQSGLDQLMATAVIP